MDIAITVVLVVVFFWWEKVFGEGSSKRYITKFLMNFQKTILILICILSGTISLADEEEKFQLIISSDPQYPWSENDDEPEKQKERESKQLIASQYKSMTKLRDDMGNSSPVKGVIVNGDLTAFGHDEQLKEYKSLLEKYLKIDYYLGLGNHDYENNINKCGTPNTNNACAARMVRYVWDHIKEIKGVSYDFDETKTNPNGSLAYSFNIKNIHLVQLHNYPSYEKHWKTNGVEFDIRPSWTWLEKDLTAARNRGDAIILNMHDFRESDKVKLKSIIKRYSVTAVFSGHIHKEIGCVETLDKVPHFRSGASTFRDYLLVEFDLENNKLIVKKVWNDFSGNYTISSGVCAKCMIGSEVCGTYTFPLLVEKGNLPNPPNPTFIAINNLGLVGASFYVEYEDSSGKKVTDYLGGMNPEGILFYKKTFMIPTGAKNIIVNARQRTGDASKPMREIFTERFGAPENACFEVYAPPSDPPWKRVPFDNCK